MMEERVRVRSDRCKGCEICRSVCPRGIIELAPEMNEKGFLPVRVVRQGECTSCGACALMCPDQAIEVYR